MSDTEEDPDDNPRKEKESDDTMEKVIHWPTGKALEHCTKDIRHCLQSHLSWMIIVV
jgi:hypothetical protein